MNIDKRSKSGGSCALRVALQHELQHESSGPNSINVSVPPCRDPPGPEWRGRPGAAARCRDRRRPAPPRAARSTHPSRCQWTPLPVQLSIPATAAPPSHTVAHCTLHTALHTAHCTMQQVRWLGRSAGSQELLRRAAHRYLPDCLILGQARGPGSQPAAQTTTGLQTAWGERCRDNGKTLRAGKAAGPAR